MEVVVPPRPPDVHAVATPPADEELPASSECVDTFILHPMSYSYDANIMLVLARSMPSPHQCILCHIRAGDETPAATHIDSINQWFSRRNISIIRSGHWIRDPESRFVYLLDFVCERRSTAQIIFVYYSHTRGGNRLGDALQYVRRVREVCHTAFLFHPMFTLLFVNTGDGSVYSYDATGSPRVRPVR